MRNIPLTFWIISAVAALTGCSGRGALDVAPNTWVQVAQDEQGARRQSSFRYVDDGQYFLLWGFMSYVTEYRGKPDEPWDGNNEYDIVTFDPQAGNWRSQYPHEKESDWRGNPPPMHLIDYYQGITTGSYRPELKERQGVLRPDLNIVFDQMAYDSKRARMIYFTGGRTFAYDVRERQWSDAAPGVDGPPPVSGATLAYDPGRDEVILAGGGHVAERGPDGKLVGYTGTWIYECERSRWRPLGSTAEPPPRMTTRLVYDTKNEVMVMFGGDAQSHYLADTWIYDGEQREWRRSQAEGGPPPRAGHFTVYDPGTGWVIVGGGYNREELTDMWAYDVASDRWWKLNGEVPVGWHVTADIMPEESLIILTTATEAPDTPKRCDQTYPMRTTYAFRVRREGLVDESAQPQPQEKMLKRPMSEVATAPDPERRKQQIERLRGMQPNQWVYFDDPGRAAPVRTWGSCTFDTDEGRIVYWGGGHCGYGGNDYDLYDVEEHTWFASPEVAEYPERNWNLGSDLAGVTFNGAPWMRHGRKVYAYDPVSKRIVNMRAMLLTAGYDPPLLRDVEPVNPDFGSGEGFSLSRYSKWVTWTYDPPTEEWEMVGSGVQGLDLTVTTPRGVMGVDYNWRGLDTGAIGYGITPYVGDKEVENSVFLLDVAGGAWRKLTEDGPWPQNLWEMTALVYDSRRQQLILHGGGPERDELWRFSLSADRWEKIEPQLDSSTGGKAPTCRREAVYIPEEDVLLTAGHPPENSDDPGIYAYRVGENRWYKVDIPAPPGKEDKVIVSQNRAWSYDPEHKLVWMVLSGPGGNLGEAEVHALRYHHKVAD